MACRRRVGQGEAPRKESAGRRNAGGVKLARRNLRPVSKGAHLNRAGAGDDVAVAESAQAVGPT
jgi:hypothetical protein